MNQVKEIKRFRFRDLKDFELGFWIICLDGLVTYSIFVASVTIGTD